MFSVRCPDSGALSFTVSSRALHERTHGVHMRPRVLTLSVRLVTYKSPATSKHRPLGRFRLPPASTNGACRSILPAQSTLPCSQPQKEQFSAQRVSMVTARASGGATRTIWRHVDSEDSARDGERGRVTIIGITVRQIHRDIQCTIRALRQLPRGSTCIGMRGVSCVSAYGHGTGRTQACTPQLVLCRVEIVCMASSDNLPPRAIAPDAEDGAWIDAASSDTSCQSSQIVHTMCISSCQGAKVV